ncbi:DMT family transporter [Trueperella pyogenes]|uniref:DMT family transporter n=1 Tax=Trueperella pyogenes TaxID=1661 RepID=UPI001CB95B57|nr:DMT family transporter [Trueperella pyogenes]
MLPMISLIGVTAVWGSTFFMIKGLLNEISALDFLSVRFILASVVSAIVIFPRLRSAKRQTWIHGLTLGLIYAMAQIFQTIGLQYTDASVSGFITGMYVVLTPIALLILFKARISPRAWGTVILATIGVAVLSLTGLTVGAGEFITLIGSAFYAVHIAFLGQWAKDDDPLTLGVIQIFGIAIFCTLGALPGGISLPQSGGSWLALAFMSLIAGLGALLTQTWAQSKISATSAAIIMTTEPVFASLFAILFGGESLTPRLVIGGGLIVSAMLLAELSPRTKSDSH